MVSQKEHSIGQLSQTAKELVERTHFNHSRANNDEVFDQLNRIDSGQNDRQMTGQSSATDSIANALQIQQDFLKCYSRSNDYTPSNATLNHNAFDMKMMMEYFTGKSMQLDDSCVTQQEFEMAKQALKRNEADIKRDASSIQFHNEMGPAEFIQSLSGVRKCPLMDFDSNAQFLQYKAQYMQNIRELVTEEEIREWDSVEKGWEKNKVGPYGYYGGFDEIVPDKEQEPYSKERAIELHNYGDNVTAIREFHKANMDNLDDEERICYLGVLAAENFMSDLHDLIYDRDDLVSKFFQCYCAKKFQEALAVCDTMLSDPTTHSMQNYCWNMKANAYSKLELYEQALECVEKAIAAKPEIAKFHANKAILMMKCGRDQKEFMLPLEKAMSMLPEHLQPALREIEEIMRHP